MTGWWVNALGKEKREDVEGSLSSIWGGPKIPSFSDVLSYDLFDPASALFELQDANEQTALGFALECVPQVGTSSQMELVLQDLPLHLPTGSSMQVILYADPEVRGQLASYCRARPGPQSDRGETIHRQMVRRRFDHMIHLPDELKPCNYRLFFSVTKPGSLASCVDIAEMQRLRQQLETSLDSCAIPSERMSAGEIVQLLGSLLNPRSMNRRGYVYNRNEPISSQLLLKDTVIDVGCSAIEVSGDGEPFQYKSLHATRYPNSMRLGGMLGLLGDPLRSNLIYLGPFVLSMCLHMIDQERARTLVTLKSTRATTNASSVMARLMPSYYRRQQNDWQICSDVLDGGGGMILLSHQVLIQAPLGEMAVAEERARAIWRTRNFTLASCEYLQLQGLMAVLPLSMTPGFATDCRTLGLLSHKTSHNAAHSMPILSEWKGTRRPAMQMVSRRGQLMNIDIFDSIGNHNLVVAGTSGSGKSVLLNEITASSLSLGAKVWIFDIGRSYIRLAQMFGGEIVQFGPKASICLNPFSAVIDIDEDMRLLKPMFTQMIAPHSGLSDLQRAQLEKAIKRVWQERGRNATPADVQAQLARIGESDSRITDMVAMLHPYTTGAHAKWFNGPATLNLNSDLIVFELEELANDPELRSVITMQLLYFVTQDMYSSRDRRKLTLIDEAYEIMRGDNVAEFIEQGYRRARKYNGAFLSATQSIADFYANPAGRSAIANSDWMMLLSQKDEELRMLINSGQLALSESEQALVRSLVTRPGRYSEVFMRCEGIASGVGRLVLDPHSELLFSSKAEDNQDLARQLAAGHDLPGALDAAIAARNDALV